MEAYQRGMWDASEDEIEKLKQIYLELEAEIEEQEEWQPDKVGMSWALHLRSGLWALRYNINLKDFHRKGAKNSVLFIGF